MKDDYMKSVLEEIAGMIKDLETQREHIDAAFVEPDVCDSCKYYEERAGGHTLPWWQCMTTKSPLASHGGFTIEQASQLCCIHFEQREVEK